MRRLALALALPLALLAAPLARAQGGPLEITVAGAELEPMPIAVPEIAPADPTLGALAADIRRVVVADLERSGLFRLVDPAAYIERGIAFDSVPSYADWRAIGADALLTARLMPAAEGRLQLQFRLFDALGQSQLLGRQLVGDGEDWRRIAHKAADAVYTQLTGEGPYFDSSIVFVDETGPKGERVKRLAIMDQDGANLRYLPSAEGLVLTPRISPDNARVLYISYDSGQPEIVLQDIRTGQRERLGNFPGMSFAPRFSPDGEEVVLSLSLEGNTDLYAMRLDDRRLRRLTRSPAIDTAASYSPDGRSLVFESDRGGSQQLYVMPAAGGPARRISFGRGRYGAPVWSPRGDLIAFTKILGGRFHIGVMRTDGSEERLLAQDFLVEGATFSPNGRVLAFYRETPGQAGRASLRSVDVTGRNLRGIPTPNAASDPSWSAVRE